MFALLDLVSSRKFPFIDHNPCPGPLAGDLVGARSALSGWWKSARSLIVNVTKLGADMGEFCLEL